MMSTGAGSNKPFSILCRGFADIDHYTQGFPNNPAPGVVLAFKLAQRSLPGPFTFILNASKSLPKVCLADTKKKSSSAAKTRKTVGVRMPSHVVCAALLARCDRPLLCGSVPLDADPASMMDAYPGVSFVIDAGPHSYRAPPSTVIDLTVSPYKIVRRGAGDVTMWINAGATEEEESTHDSA